MPICSDYQDTGVNETGNNDLPCHCPAGDGAMFNLANVSGQVTGAKVKRHILNESPEPIRLTGNAKIAASSLPGRNGRS